VTDPGNIQGEGTEKNISLINGILSLGIQCEASYDVDDRDCIGRGLTGMLAQLYKFTLPLL
jgi:hypothetical protein